MENNNLEKIKPPERQVEIKRFSKEGREALEKRGFAIYVLEGNQSIETRRNEGRKFHSKWHDDFPDIENLTSMRSEVAINPKNFFLPKSNESLHLNFKEERDMVEEYSRKLRKEIPGVKAIVGEFPDYVETAFQHLDATGEYLFGTNNTKRIRTMTLVEKGKPEQVVGIGGDFTADRGLSVIYIHINDDEKSCPCPLIVPV